MDKWTRTFINSGASNTFQEVLSVIESGHDFEAWARRHTDGMFGAIFSLGQAQEFLHFNPILAKDLSKKELNRYRKICAAAVLSQETQIPPLFLMFRPWGYQHMREYLWNVQETVEKSRWDWIDETWVPGLAAVNSVDLSTLSDLDESAKLLLYRLAHQNGRMSAVEIPAAPLSLPLLYPSVVDDCVIYTLENMKSIDLATILKDAGLTRSGTKAERTQRILGSMSHDELAKHLRIKPGTYLQLGKSNNERRILTTALTFLYNIAHANFRLDFQYTHNAARIEQARIQNWGIRLTHHAECPVHHKNVYHTSLANVLGYM